MNKKHIASIAVFLSLCVSLTLNSCSDSAKKSSTSSGFSQSKKEVQSEGGHGRVGGRAQGALRRLQGRVQKAHEAILSARSHQATGIGHHGGLL